VASVLLKITKTVESALQSESRVEQRNALTLLSKLAAVRIFTSLSWCLCM
jgi:hypothetical protein